MQEVVLYQINCKEGKMVSSNCIWLCYYLPSSLSSDDQETRNNIFFSWNIHVLQREKVKLYQLGMLYDVPFVSLSLKTSGPPQEVYLRVHLNCCSNKDLTSVLSSMDCHEFKKQTNKTVLWVGKLWAILEYIWSHSKVL